MRSYKTRFGIFTTWSSRLFMNPPQKVTSRYVRNLLIKGTNNDFTIVSLERQCHLIDNITIGFYYTTAIGGGNFPTKEAVGVTPEQAVHRCLEKHGVTFR